MGIGRVCPLTLLWFRMQMVAILATVSSTLFQFMKRCAHSFDVGHADAYTLELICSTATLIRELRVLLTASTMIGPFGTQRSTIWTVFAALRSYCM